jgi:nucleotide-binding universal stress UspA family protein
VAILVLFIARGFFAVESQLHSPFIPEGWGVVISGVGLVIVSFTGFEKVSSVAEEIKKPGRSLPRAIIGSVVIATVLYAGVVFVMTGVVQPEQLSQAERPLVRAGEAVWGRFGEIMLLFGGLLATASSANAAIMASSRINFAMGRDRILPKWFGAVSKKHHTPHHAIFITGGLAILLALTGAAGVLAEIGSALFMISYALLAAGVLIMRSTKPEWYKPAFRVPLYPWLPLVGGFAALAVILTMETLSQTAGLGLAGASLVLYYLWGRKHHRIESELQRALQYHEPGELVKKAIAGETIQMTAERDAEAEKTGAVNREILIGAGNIEDARRTVQIAKLIAAGRTNAGLRVVKVQEVPQTMPMKYAQEHFTEEDIDPDGVLREIRQSFETDPIQIETETQLARSIPGGILQAANSNEKIDLILLGWTGEINTQSPAAHIDKKIGSETVLPVAVLIARELSELKRILVLGGADEHARMALSLGKEIQAGSGAKMIVFQREYESDSPEKQREEKNFKEVLGSLLDQAEIRPLQKLSSEQDILEDINIDCDLIVAGSPANWSVSDWVFGSLSDRIARRAKCPVLITHLGQGGDQEDDTQ